MYKDLLALAFTNEKISPQCADAIFIESALDLFIDSKLH